MRRKLVMISVTGILLILSQSISAAEIVRITNGDGTLQSWPAAIDRQWDL